MLEPFVISLVRCMISIKVLRPSLETIFKRLLILLVTIPVGRAWSKLSTTDLIVIILIYLPSEYRLFVHILLFEIRRLSITLLFLKSII